MTEPEDSRIECPPPPEWIAKNAGNVVVGGGRMMKGTVQLKYKNHYDVLADPKVDALDADYGSSFGRFCSAYYGYLKATKADAGHSSDTGGTEGSDGMPGSDFYMALSKRFAEQSRAVYAQTKRPSGHWDTLKMLMKPLPEGCNVNRLRSALFVIIPQINTALGLLEEYSEEISRAWKRANAPTAEEEHARR